VVFNLLSNESDILERCDPMSIVAAIKDAAAMGLEPGTSDGSLVRYGTKCVFLPMWQGYLKRIRNSGQVGDVDVQLVCQGDEFRYTLGTNPEIIHVPALEDRGPYTHVYAWASMPSGAYIVDVMTVDEVNVIRDTHGAKSGGKLVGPWLTDYGEMARKTAIRRLAKRLPASATQQILMVDARADEVQREVKVVKDQMADVRAIALKAVGLGPAPEPTPALSEGAPAPEDAEATPTTEDLIAARESGVLGS